MKLRYSTTSPFVRKVTVLALEIGLDKRIERVPANPWDPDGDLQEDNPLGKVPALILDDGQVLVDSTFICEYLDSQHDGPRMFPEPGPARWRALRLQHLANGVLEAAVLHLVEALRRPKELRWSWWMERQRDKIAQTLDVLEREAGDLDGPPDIGRLTVAIALDYVDFRLPDFAWREGRSGLEAWHQNFGQRPSLQATMPREA